MRLILNILWLVLCGFWMALGWLLAALLMFILIIPFALQALKLAVFALWPFAGGWRWVTSPPAYFSV